MNSDVPEFYEHLKTSTIALLGYSDANLTPAQEIRISRAISLRLIVDTAQARQLRGETIDVKTFVDASASLERMVPGGNPDNAAAGHDFAGAKVELEAFLAKRAAALPWRTGGRERAPAGVRCVNHRATGIIIIGAAV
jgi:hypothetical protein